MTGQPYKEPMHKQTAASRQKTLWSTISGTPPVFVGLAGAVILALEGQILELLFTLLLVAIHRYSGQHLTRRYLSTNQVADWTGIRVMTTVSCLALPFYLALTVS